MFFFDTNSILIQIKQKREIKKIENNIQYYNQEIKSDNMKINILIVFKLNTQAGLSHIK